MKFKLVLLMVFISGYSFAEESKPILLNNWVLKENLELKVSNVNVLNIENNKDNSNITVMERNGGTIAVSSTIRNHDSVGIQYKDGDVAYVRIQDFYRGNVYKPSYIKLFKVNNNWLLVEFKDASEKTILRKAELK